MDEETKAYIEDILENEEWCGQCRSFGILSILSCYGYVDPAKYQEGAVNLYEIKLPESDELKSLFTYYDLIQCRDDIYIDENDGIIDETQPERLQRIIRDLEEGKIVRSGMGYTYTNEEGEKKWGGHVIVFYGIEDGVFIADDNSVYNKKLLTYDSNYVDYYDRACVLVNTDDYSWINQEYEGAASRLGGTIGFSASDPLNINYHNMGLLGENNYTPPIDQPTIIRTNYLSADSTLQAIELNEDGSYSICPASDDCYELFVLSSSSASTKSKDTINYLIKDNTKAYLLTCGETGKSNIKLSTNNEKYVISFDNADEVILDPNGMIRATGNASDYNISIISKNDSSPTDWSKVEVSGEASQVEFRRTDDGYILSGDDLTDVKVSANGNTYEPACSFSTDYDKVLIHEITEDEIGISVDADDNGSFETQIETMEVTDILLGDLTGDKLIDANDATMILGLYAKLSTGSKDVTQESITLGDVNKDGLLDASDATLVLEYYSHASTGGTTKSEDFFKARQGNK